MLLIVFCGRFVDVGGMVRFLALLGRLRIGFLWFWVWIVRWGFGLGSIRSLLGISQPLLWCEGLIEHESGQSYLQIKTHKLLSVKNIYEKQF